MPFDTPAPRQLGFWAEPMAQRVQGADRNAGLKPGAAL